MREVLRDYFRASFLFFIFFSGCGAIIPTSETSQSIAVQDSIAVENRIFFPEYNLSMGRPPENWVMQQELGEMELALWVNKETGAVFEIMVSRAARNLSYHNIAVEFNRMTCDMVQQSLQTVTCAITDEQIANFNNNKFYLVKINYQGLFHDGGVRSLVYLHKTDNYVFYFLLMEEKYNLLAKEMLQTVVFHEAKYKDPKKVRNQQR